MSSNAPCMYLCNKDVLKNNIKKWVEKGESVGVKSGYV